MNKNDILRIARSLYLQQTIARQLFAKFDIDQDLSQFSGSFARPNEKIIDLFDIFIGFAPFRDYTQIIQKNGTNFTVYGLSVNGQIDKNISQQISGWANLANFFANVSSQVVAPGQSFHESMHNVVKQVSAGIDFNYQLPNESQFYNKMLSNYQGDKSKTDIQFKIWKINQLLSKWQDNIISALDRTIELANSIKLFTLSNKTNSIVSNLIQLRSIISQKISYYKNNNVAKLLNKTAFNTAITTIQTYINENELVKSLLTKGKETNSIKESSSNLLSRIAQHTDQLQQMVVYFENNSSNQLAQGLLDAFNNSNNAQQLISNCSSADFDCTKSFKKQFEQKNLLDYQKNMQKGGTQAGDWKAKIQPFINFIKGIGDTHLRYSSWANNYNLLKNRFQNQQNQLLIIENFNQFIDLCFTNSELIKSSRTKYMRSYNACKKYEEQLLQYDPNSRLYAKINNKKLSKERQMNNQYNILLNSVFTTKYKDILDRIIMLDKQAMDTYKYNSIAVQGVAKNAYLSLPYIWVKDSKLLKDMLNLADAI